MKFKDFYIDLLLEYNKDLLPEIFKNLEAESDPMVGVHFSQGIGKMGPDNKPIIKGKNVSKEPHLGMNKSPAHRDPIGIYTFPKNYVLKGGLQKNGFFSSAKFFYIIKPIQNKCKILNLSKLNEVDIPELIKKMEIPESYLSDETIYHRSTKDMKAGHRLWGIMEKYRSDTNQSRNNYSWNKLFKKANINCIWDEGDAIVHSNEPEQIIYMEPDIYEVIHTNHSSGPISNGISEIIQAFPDLVKKKSSEYGEPKYSLFSKEHKNFQVVITYNEQSGHLSLNIYGTSPKFERKTYSIIDSDIKSDFLGYEEFSPEKIINVIRNEMGRISPEDDYKSTYQKTSTEFLNDLKNTYNLKLTKTKSGDFYFLKKGFDKSADSPVSLKINLWGNPTIEIERRKPYGWRNYSYYYSEKSITPENYSEFGIEKTISKLLNGLEDYIKNYKPYGDESSEIYKKEGALKFVKIIREKIFRVRNLPQ